MINALRNLSLAQLKRAVDIKEKIQSLESQLNELVGAASRPVATRAAVESNGKPRRRKGKWSAAKRAKMAAMKRAWWASRSGAARKPRRPLSAAARANISRGAKRRWAKAAGKL